MYPEVSSSQATSRRWWVAGVAHTEHVWKRQKQSVGWLQPEWRVQCESGRSPRLLLEPLTVHRGSGSPLPGVLYRMPLGKPVCRWPGHHQWMAGGITTEVDPLEDQHGRKGTPGQHGQNQGSDILALGSVCFRSLAKTPVACVSKGLVQNPFFCGDCSSWIHMKRSGIPGCLKSDASFRCNGALDRPDQ